MKTTSTLILLISLVSCSQKDISYDLIVANVNLIDGTGASLQEGVNVFVQDGKIEKIDTGAIGQAQNILDGTSKYLIPGLFDCHIHTTDYQRDFPRLMHYGVTSIFITGGSLCTNEYYATLREIGSQDSFPAPRVFHTSQHFTMEGRHPVKTYASNNWREGKSVFYLRDTLQIAELVKEVSDYPILGIKLTIEDGPAPPFVTRMPQEFINKTVKEAAKYDLEVFAHVSDTEEFLMAVKGKAQNLVHYVGVELDWENEEHVEAIEAFKRTGGSIISTLIIDKSFLYPLNPSWLENPYLTQVYPERELQSLLTENVINRAKRIAKRTAQMYSFDTLTLEKLSRPSSADIQKVMDMDINVALGSDAGNLFNFHGYSLHEEMQILQDGGIAPLQIIKMGTLNAAKMMKVENELGSIELGKIADLVLLNENPLASISNTLDIKTVIKNGVIQRRFDP